MRTCEQSRESSVSLAISTGNDTQKSNATGFELNESAALIDAHFKRYKFHTEDDNCCYAVIHRLENFRCNIACERPRSELPDVFNDRRNCRENATDHFCDTTDDDCNGVDLITVVNYVMDAGCIVSIACIDSDADYTESSKRGSDASGYYYGNYYGSEQALR